MNNNENNNKQINRIATPIKLDKNGERIESNDNPVILTTEDKKEIIKTRKIKEKNKKIEEHDPTTAVFVVVLLIILAILAAFICLYIVPRYIDSKNLNLQYNDKPNYSTTTKKVYPLTKYTLVDSVYINTASTYKVGNYDIEMEYNGSNFNVIINGVLLTRSDYVLPNVAIVDNLLLIATQDKSIRSTHLYAVDEAGVLINEWYQIGKNDGMLLLPDSSSIIFNSVNFVLLGSRVNGNKIMLHSTDTLDDGINLCGSDTLLNNGITEAFTAIATYNIEYIGNKQFSEPKLMFSTSISDYKTANNICN